MHFYYIIKKFRSLTVYRLRSIVYYENGEQISEKKSCKSNPVMGRFEYYDVKDIQGDASSIEHIFEIGTTVEGLRWKKFGPGFLDGWLYGKVDKSGHFTGHDIAYIYADLTTVIYGTFDNGVLIQGRERKVKGFR